MHLLENTARAVTLSSWGVSRQGDVYKENQDSFLNWPDRMFWSVADGVGSTAHGAEASKAVTRAFLSLGVPDSLDFFVEEARAKIAECNNSLYNQLTVAGSAASTVVALLMHGSQAACLWAGDSRCYLLRNDVLYQCTHDHTLRQHMIDRKELTAPEAYRMIKGNVITNAIGGQAELQLDEVRFALQAGDRFLLCSDGLGNLLNPAALQQYMSRGTPRECCDAISAAFHGRRMEDNVTFIAVFISWT